MHNAWLASAYIVIYIYIYVCKKIRGPVRLSWSWHLNYRKKKITTTKNITYPDKAVMEVHAKECCCNGRVIFESLLNNFPNNLLRPRARRVVKTKSKLGCDKRNKKKKKAYEYKRVLHFKVFSLQEMKLKMVFWYAMKVVG